MNIIKSRAVIRFLRVTALLLKEVYDDLDSDAKED